MSRGQTRELSIVKWFKKKTQQKPLDTGNNLYLCQFAIFVQLFLEILPFPCPKKQARRGRGGVLFGAGEKLYLL